MPIPVSELLDTPGDYIIVRRVVMYMGQRGRVMRQLAQSSATGTRVLAGGDLLLHIRQEGEEAITPADFDAWKLAGVAVPNSCLG